MQLKKLRFNAAQHFHSPVKSPHQGWSKAVTLLLLCSQLSAFFLLMRCRWLSDKRLSSRLKGVWAKLMCQAFKQKHWWYSRFAAVISELFRPMAWLVWQASSGKAKFSFLQKKYCFLMFLRTKLTFDLCNVCLSTVFARNCSLGTRSLGLEKTSPGGRFSKDPVTYRARKSILETVIRLPWKAALLLCFGYKERQNNCQVSKLETCS